MADFVAVLKKTIDGLSDNTPAMREKVYRKARDTIAAKLAAIDPPPSRIVVERQHKALDDAIQAVEASYAVQETSSDDFESVLAGLGTFGAEPASASPNTLPEAAPAPAATTAPVFTTIEPAQRSGRFDLSPLAARPEPRAPEADLPTGGGDAADDEGLTPIASMPREEPPLPKPLAGETGVAIAKRAPGRDRRRFGGLVAAVVVLLVVGAAGYGIWLNRTEFSAMLGMGGGTVVAEEPADIEAQPETEVAAEPAVSEEPAQPEQEVAAAAPQPEPAAPPPAQQAAPESAAKFTQRLTSDGQEIDEGPAGGEPAIGEGTSLATATPGTQPAPAQTAQAGGDAQAPAQEATAADNQGVPVGQRAIFYEERTNVAEGSADTGSTVWSIVQESPGGDLPPEPAIRAEVAIPAKDMQLRMTIRRNGDKTLPASHIVEMIFLTSGTFEGGGVDNVLRIALKNSEAAPGSPLIGIPAKIADGYFLVALSDGAAELETNTQLMLRQSWIDIPIVYRSGRRALVTMEKGVPGDRVFQEALQAWRSASSG